MARKNAAETQEEATIDKSSVNTESESVPIPGKWVAEENAAGQPTVDTNGPELRDGHDQVVEETGIGGITDMSAPMGDPGDLGAFGQSARLPDDLGLGDGGFGGPVDVGTDLGSTLLDDLAGDLSDQGGSLDGMSDGTGPGGLDDQTGWAMDSGDDALAGTSSGEYFTSVSRLHFEAEDAYAAGDTVLGDFLTEAREAAGTAGINALEEEREALNLQSDPIPEGASGTVDDPHEIAPTVITADDDDDDEGERQGGGGDDGTSGSQSMPAPDDGTGGDPDAGDLIGGRGDVDPPRETEEHRGGELVGGRGDVDPDPDLDEPDGGAIDTEMLGLGAIDPLEGESTLLGGDEGDLAEMAAEADLGGDIEVELDVSVVDADIGEDV